jgi:hypothetical protein
LTLDAPKVAQEQCRLVCVAHDLHDLVMQSEVINREAVQDLLKCHH